MKKTLLFVLVFVSVTSFSQALLFEGKILDKKTNEAIPYATIAALPTSQGVISNEDGVFKFYVPNNCETVEISFIGYKSKSYFREDLPKEFITIFLENDELALEEVIVTNKPISVILSGLLANSKTQLDKNIKLETYYREFVKINNKNSKFADGLIDYYLEPKRKNKVKAKLIVNQSRAVQLASGDEIESKGKADLSELDSFFNIQEAADGFFSYSIVERIVSKENAEKYDFELRSMKDSYGNGLEIIYVKPKENIKEALLTGKIIFDPIAKVVLDIDLKMSEHHRKHVEIINALIMKIAFHDIQIKQTYKYADGKYIPNYKKSVLDVYVKFGKTMNDRIICVSDLMVTKFDDDNTESPDKAKVFKERSLYENGINFFENFWETNNALPLSANEEKILESLKSK